MLKELNHDVEMLGIKLQPIISILISFAIDKCFILGTKEIDFKFRIIEGQSKHKG